MSKLIDYDAQFKEYFDEWYEANKEKYTKPDQIEQELANIYDKWAEKERKELDSLSSEELNELFVQYAELGEVPDLICEALLKRGKEGEESLYTLFRTAMLSEGAVITIINLLAEMHSALPYTSYLSMLSEGEEEGGAAEAAAEALAEAPKEYFDQILEAYNSARSVWGKELLMNALVHIKADKRLYEGLVQLLDSSDNTAFVAAMMAESGDDRCIDRLKELEYSKGINYIDYVEICNAIEALGGETLRDREFEGDTYYEMMKSPQE